MAGEQCDAAPAAPASRLLLGRVCGNVDSMRLRVSSAPGPQLFTAPPPAAAAACAHRCRNNAALVATRACTACPAAPLLPAPCLRTQQERATMKELMRSELFVPRYAIPLEEERELALRRLQVRPLCSGFVRVCAVQLTRSLPSRSASGCLASPAHAW